jgi:hypothetical protein
MTVRALLIAFIALLLAAPALNSANAAEQIDNFDVLVEVETDGDIIVTETIQVTAEGSQIRRGIFRDLPRYYELDGDRLPFEYDVLSVTRDGQDEPYETSNEGAAAITDSANSHTAFWLPNNNATAAASGKTSAISVAITNQIGCAA